MFKPWFIWRKKGTCRNLMRNSYFLIKYESESDSRSVMSDSVTHGL